MTKKPKPPKVPHKVTKLKQRPHEYKKPRILNRLKTTSLTIRPWEPRKTKIKLKKGKKLVIRLSKMPILKPFSLVFAMKSKLQTKVLISTRNSLIPSFCTEENLASAQMKLQLRSMKPLSQGINHSVSIATLQA